MAILRLKDEQDNWIEVPALKGDKGDKGDPGLTEDEIKAIVADDAVLKSEIQNDNNEVTALYSLAVGNGNKITGTHTLDSFVAGDRNTVNISGTSDSNGFAFGLSNTVSGKRGMAIGQRNNVTGQGGIAFGSYCKASGMYSVAGGNGDTTESNTVVASGAVSVAFGQTAQSTGNFSLAFGRIAKSNGDTSVAIGREIEANHKCQMAIGYGNASTEGDVFEVGNGTTDGDGFGVGNLVTRQNAFVVKQDGSAIAQTALGIGETTFTESDIEAWNNKSGVFREMSVSEYEALEDKSGWFLVYGD